jgi:hypothetical protein
MGASTYTSELDLPQFAGPDKPTWRGDVNDAFLKIDTAVHGLRNAFYRNVKTNDGAIGDGVAIDSDAIDSGIAACVAAGGGTLFFPKGDYKINKQHVVPACVRLLGEGGRHPGVSPAATRILASNAASSLKFTGAGTGMEEIQFDGANVATNGVIIGGTVAGDRGAYQFFANISVIQCTGDGLLLYGSQNGILERVQSLNNGGRGLVLDYSPGGWSFIGCEFSGNTGVQCEGLNTAAGPLLPNAFYECIFEYGTTDTARVKITAGNNWRFYSCNFATQLFVGAVQPMVDVLQGQHLFDSSTVSIGSTAATIAFRASNGALLTFTGQNSMSGFGTTDVYWFDGVTGGRMVLIGEYPTNTLVTHGNLLTATTTQTQNGAVVSGFRQIVRGNASFYADYFTVLGEAFNRHERYMNGVQTWGSGAASYDVQIGRASAGVLEVAGPNTYGGLLKGGRVARQSLVGAAGAAQTLKEIGLFDQQVITLTGGTACTFTAPTYVEGATFTLIIGCVTGATIVWPATFKFPGGAAPALSANGKIDIFHVRCSLNLFFVQSVQNY